MGKSVVERPVSLPSTTFSPVTSSAAFHPSVGSPESFDAFVKSHNAAGGGAFLVGFPSTLALSKRSTRWTIRLSFARLHAVIVRRMTARTHRFMTILVGSYSYCTYPKLFNFSSSFDESPSAESQELEKLKSLGYVQ